jgi:hypothetical protein
MKSKHNKYPSCLGSRQGQERDLVLNSTQSKTIYGTNSNNLIDTQVLFSLQHSSVSLVKKKTPQNNSSLTL